MRRERNFDEIQLRRRRATIAHILVQEFTKPGTLTTRKIAELRAEIESIDKQLERDELPHP